MPPVRTYKKNYFTSKPKLSTAHDQAIKKYVQKAIRQADKRNANAGLYSNNMSTDTIDGKGYAFNPLSAITQGDAGDKRKGRVIKLDSLEICWNWYAANNTSANFVHMYVYWSDEELTISGTALGIANADLVTDLPLTGPYTTNSGCTTLLYDNYRCTPLFHKVYAVPNYDSANKMALGGTMKFNLKGVKKTFLQDSASYFEGKNLYVAWIAAKNNPDGTIGTTSVGNMAMNYVVRFRQ